MNADIHFNYLVPAFTFKNRNNLKLFLEKLFNEEKHPLESLSYTFCTDEFLYQYNKTYLNHNTLTDIITFSLSEDQQPIIGDIYISLDRVKENAKTHHQSFNHELHRVIFHGALHLCGYKDKTNAEALSMRQMEEYYLNKYFVSRGTL